jgi:hypothetical protein
LSTIESLEVRLSRLETAMAEMRQRLADSVSAATPIERGLRILERARARAPLDAAQAQELARAMGLTAVPLSPEQVRAHMIREGVRPEDNAFSRQIKDDREG